MLRESVPTLLILVGVVLAANPLWAFPHAGEPTYTYEAQKIEYTDDYLRAGGNLESVDCYGPGDQQPGCVLWTRVAQQGPMTVNFSGMDRFNYGSRYVVVEEDPDHWTFYERVVEGSTSSVTLRLEQMTPAEILANVSIGYDDLGEPGQEAVRTGSATVRSDSLRGEGQVVRYEGDYYAIRYAGNQPPTWGGGQAQFLRGVLALVGLAVALHGQRRRLA